MKNNRKITIIPYRRNNIDAKFYWQTSGTYKETSKYLELFHEY